MRSQSRQGLLQFAPGIFVVLHLAPVQPAGMAPGIQHDSLLESLAKRGENDAIMFPPGIGPGDPAMELERTEVEGIEFYEEIIGPMKTQTLLPQAHVYQHVMKMGRPNDFILAGELKRIGMSDFGGVGGVGGKNTGTELLQVLCQPSDRRVLLSWGATTAEADKRKSKRNQGRPGLTNKAYARPWC